MECPMCKAVITDSAKYCNQCGCVINDNICSACGHSNNAGAKFCGGCGKDFGQEGIQQRNTYQITQPDNQSMGFTIGSSEYGSYEQVKPPYAYAIFDIILGIVTATIVPSILGIFSLIKCIQASDANSRFDYEEAKRLSRQAIWNPLGLSKTALWVSGIIGGIVIVILIIIMISN